MGTFRCSPGGRVRCRHQACDHRGNSSRPWRRARWALAGGVAAFELALALFHIGAEWTSPLDPTFIARLVVASLAIVLAAASGGVAPLAIVALAAAAVLCQLLLEAFTFPEGAATIWEPPRLAEESAG